MSDKDKDGNMKKDRNVKTTNLEKYYDKATVSGLVNEILKSRGESVPISAPIIDPYSENTFTGTNLDSNTKKSKKVNIRTHAKINIIKNNTFDPIIDKSLDKENEGKTSNVKFNDTKSNREITRENNALLYGLPKYEAGKTQIYPMTPEEIRTKSVLNVNRLSKENGITQGLFDSRMGSVTNKELCITCNRDDQGCCGHMGYFQLPKKIVNCIFKKETIYALKSICPYCGDTYIDDIIYKALHLDKVPKKKLAKVVAEISEKWLWKLHNHGYAQIIYENNFRKSKLLFTIDTDTKVKTDDLEEKLTGKRVLSVNSMEKIYKAVPEDKWKYIGFPGITRPLNFITDVVACCPPHIRPASIVNGKPMDHQLTTRYIELLKCIIKIQEHVGNTTDKDSA